MDYNEALFLSNFRRFAHYDGYQKTLKMKSPAMENESRKDFFAIDAIKYSKDGSTKNGASPAEDQYKVSNILRELNKALVGFSFPEESRFNTISTGKWGCGAFGGDPQLKFLIQWMAASIVNKPLLFHTF